MNELESLCKNNKAKEVKDLMKKLIKIYHPNSNIVDHIYNEQILIKETEQNLTSNSKKNFNVVKIK